MRNVATLIYEKIACAMRDSNARVSHIENVFAETCIRTFKINVKLFLKKL